MIEILTPPDIAGHIASSMGMLGTYLLAYRKRIGWYLRLVQHIIWVSIGFYLGLTSIWFWESIFAGIDIMGIIKWRKYEKEKERANPQK